MRSWLKTFGAAIKVVVFSSSLALVVSLSFAGTQSTYRDVDATAQKLSDAELRHALAQDPNVAKMVRGIVGDEGFTSKDLGKVRGAIHALAVAETAIPQAPGGSAADRARSIKSRSPLYHDGGAKETSSWLSRAFQRLGEAISNFFSDRTAPTTNMPAPTIFGSWLIYLMWTLLAIVLIGFIAFAISRFAWRKKLGRKAALLDDDEPERTLDEWLTLANELEAEGRYREAVRCLYLACLLKFDEKLVARFDRGETNWEHLSRIEASTRRPASIDFRPPTQAFDRVWYGHLVEGRTDVDRFRAWYSDVVDQLAKVTA